MGLLSLPLSLAELERGFTGLTFLQNTVKSGKYFVLRIGNKYKLEFDKESELIQIGTGQKRGLYRVIQFCDLETHIRVSISNQFTSNGGGSNF